MPVIVDDGLLVSAIPGGAAAGTGFLGGLPPRVLVLDDVYDAAGLWARSASPKYADFLTLTLSFDDALGRVTAVGAGMEPFVTATLERSPDQIRWTTVRGAVEVTVVDGGVTVYDFEYVAGAVNYYRLVTLSPFGQTATDDITPDQTDVWLKSVARPFLNLVVDLAGDTFTISRASRASVYEIVGRSLPVAVSDVRGSRSFAIVARTDTAADADALDLLLASGDVLYLHAPEGCVVPAGGLFVVPGDTDMTWPTPPVEWRLTTIPLREVADPGPDVAGALGTWQTAINAYATWGDMILAQASWASTLTLIGDASEVIVP